MHRLFYLLCGIVPDRPAQEEESGPRRILTNHFIDWDFNSKEEYTCK